MRVRAVKGYKFLWFGLVVEGCAIVKDTEYLRQLEQI
jgi:hypothetical protein